MQQFVTLVQLDSSVGTDADKLSCANFAFEIEARNDADNLFSECRTSMFAFESSSQQLCLNSQVTFTINGMNTLVIEPNSISGTFDLYLWAFVVDSSDTTSIYNKRASKLIVTITEP